MKRPVAVLQGRRIVAWRPVSLEDGRRAWLKAGPIGRILAMRTRLLASGLVWLLAVTAITHLVGWIFAWPTVFGGLRVGAIALYAPGQFLGWRPLLGAGHRWIVDVATGLSLACALALGWRVWLDWAAHRTRWSGASRWADRADVRRSGLR